VSITELTTASAWIAGLAIVSLVAAGWRKPARATVDPSRGRRRSARRRPVRVETVSTTLHRRPPVWRRVWAVFASGVIGVVTGAVLATVIAAGVAWTVVTLTDMLRQ
jgi:hypothetical protein